MSIPLPVLTALVMRATDDLGSARKHAKFLAWSVRFAPTDNHYRLVVAFFPTLSTAERATVSGWLVTL